ncbi:MAG: hypothetical protein PVI90_02440 [Desulfobacteraceae bacterium]
MPLTTDELIELYETALSAILDGSQSYSIAGKSMTRADLSYIQTQLDKLYIRKQRETAGGIIVRGGTPVD